MSDKQAAKRQSELKFGTNVIAEGFTIVPSLLLQCQERLGISAQQLAILIHLLDFWWDHESKPWPSKEKIATRLQVSTKTVQRHVRELEEAGYVKRVKRYKTNKGQTSNEYDLSGLILKLKSLAEEVRQASQKADAIKKDSTRPKHRRKFPSSGDGQ